MADNEKICSCCGNRRGCDCYSTQSPQFREIQRLRVFAEASGLRDKIEMNPTVLDLIEQALKAGGYDGLYSPDGECSCTMEDLCPCDEPGIGCRAGYKRACPGPECPWGCPEGSFHIASEKPEVQP